MKTVRFLNGLTLIFIIINLSSCNQHESNTIENGNGDYRFSHNIPIDVDSSLQYKLKSDDDVFKLNQEFNRFSWRAFIAINWPMNADGEPLPNLTDKGIPAWQGWKEAFQVYRKDGQVPEPWKGKRVDGGWSLSSKLLSSSDHRIILLTRTPTNPNPTIADEDKQAFAGRLYDQNGNIIVYEVLMNEAEFDYVVENKLYNRNGQVQFYSAKGDVNFPNGGQSVGAIEIKFAWKQLTPGDPLNERYFQTNAFIIDPETGTIDSTTYLLGMVGMHISQKTPTAKQWVWSTFEHVDNLDQNVYQKSDGEVAAITPTLRDPECEICPANVDFDNDSSFSYQKDNHGNYWIIDGDSNKYYTNSNVLKTQSKRMVDIPVRVRLFNNEMQEYLRSINSVWQYYRLIDTQYPLDQHLLPAKNTLANYHLPQSVTNKPGGKPNIALLTNISMETFFQGGNQDASNLIEGNLDNSTSGYQIFGTESCMGCHSSAGIYSDLENTAGQLSGDFSWLLGRATIDSSMIQVSK